MDEFELVASNFSLKLVVLNPTVGSGWCQLFLLDNNRIEDLGQNEKKKILGGLLDVLNAETFPKVRVTINEKFYGCCMMLYVKETCAYARQIDSSLELLFLDSNLQPIATVHLSSEECQSWKEQLLQLL